MLYKVEGIVIRSMDYGEGHKIISVYTREAGKMSVMVRGAKKLNSRFGAITQLFTYGQFVFYKGNSAMGNLNAGEIIDSHQKLREDLMKGAYAAYIAEMVEKLTGENEPNGMLFTQLEAAFGGIGEGKPPAFIAHVMEMKMLGLSGYLPELDQCVSCGRTEGDMALSFQGGGLLCPSCRGRDPQALLPGPGTLKLLRLLRHVDLRRLGQVEMKPATERQLKQCMRGLTDMYLDSRWKSRSFLDQMEKYGMGD
ncbi:DNA repair protein RecO [Gorillibacterium sp. sgz5001074]|uniref:DNA repair protein RecO n=1 Tax=Gorillibacterium sp. sgz5001074 TaxID=3446695 RepID=UPI003F669BDA